MSIKMAEGEPKYVLHATAIVGCSISLFFCLLALLALFCFRPRTEALAVKKHLTVAVFSTQFILLTGIFGYGEEAGCRTLSVFLHFSATASFSWCAIDALCLYFFHVNSFHPTKSVKFYILLGWGLPLLALIASLLVGLYGTKSQHLLSLYTCWSSDHVLWSFVVPSIVLAAVNIGILCTILRQLRQPSYDVCPKSIMEKRGTRYGLRTNSLMLLGLCLGWIFAMLSFRDVDNVRYQLTFGLVNGLQGIFLFFFHCVLNSDHVKNSGYSSAGDPKTQSTSSGLPDSRSKKVEPQEDENVASSQPKQEPGAALVTGVLQVNVTSAPKRPKSVEQLRVTPDYETIIPQLPGTPDLDRDEQRTSLPAPVDQLRVTHDRDRQRMSLPVELPAPRRSSQGRPLSANAGSSSRASSSQSDKIKKHENFGAEQSTQLQVTRPSSSNERRRKARSEPTIPCGPDSGRNGESAERKTSRSEGASRLRAQSTDNRPRKGGRPHGSSLNELESLFSNAEFTKPHRPSVSSLQGPGRRERRVSAQSQDARLRKESSLESRDVADVAPGGQTEVEADSSSRPQSRSTQKTML